MKNLKQEQYFYIFQDQRSLIKFGTKDVDFYKLHQYGYSDDLVSLFTNFLTNWKQRVILNGQN